MPRSARKPLPPWSGARLRPCGLLSVWLLRLLWRHLLLFRSRLGHCRSCLKSQNRRCDIGCFLEKRPPRRVMCLGHPCSLKPHSMLVVSPCEINGASVNSEPIGSGDLHAELSHEEIVITVTLSVNVIATAPSQQRTAPRRYIGGYQADFGSGGAVTGEADLPGRSLGPLDACRRIGRASSGSPSTTSRRSTTSTGGGSFPQFQSIASASAARNRTTSRRSSSISIGSVLIGSIPDHKILCRMAHYAPNFDG